VGVIDTLESSSAKSSNTLLRTKSLLAAVKGLLRARHHSHRTGVRSAHILLEFSITPPHACMTGGCAPLALVVGPEALREVLQEREGQEPHRVILSLACRRLCLPPHAIHNKRCEIKRKLIFFIFIFLL
jgi:hypothetical protein